MTSKGILNEVFDPIIAEHMKTADAEWDRGYAEWYAHYKAKADELKKLKKLLSAKIRESADNDGRVILLEILLGGNSK